MPATMKHTSTTAFARLSSILPIRMPLHTHYSPGGLINIGHPPIIQNQLCMSLSDPTLVTTELLTSYQVAHQRKQEEAVNSKCQPGTSAMRFFTKIGSFCTTSFGKHGPLYMNCAPPACISLSNSTVGTTEAFTLLQVARQHKQGKSMRSNYRPGRTAIRYLTKIRTIAFGKPGSLSTNGAQPSSNFLSNTLETIITVHSLSSLATTNADDTFVTADELSVSLCSVLFSFMLTYINVASTSPILHP
jgi:hypothetical protein